MNTQSRNSKKNRVYENSWNNIKDLIKIRKTQKLLKFEEMFSEVIHTISKKSASLQVEPIDKIITTSLPKNVNPGQIYDLYVDGKYMKIKSPDNSVEGNKISFKTHL